MAKLKGKAKAAFVRKMAAARAKKGKRSAKRSNPKRPGSVVVALANPISTGNTGRMSSKKRRTSKKKRSNPRHRRAASAAPRRRRRLRANPTRRHRRRRRNPGMGPIAQLAIGAALGAIAGAGVELGFDRVAALGNLPDIAKTGIKVAGAAGAIVLGAKHPAAASGIAAGLLATEAKKAAQKILPPPAADAARVNRALNAMNMGAVYGGDMGAVYGGDMGAVGVYPAYP